MNKVEPKKNKSLSIDLTDRSSDNFLTDQLKDLKKSGNDSVSLDIKNSSGEETVKLQVDINIFSRIKEIQELPDWVIIKLILADRKLKDSGFENRFSNG